MRLLLIIILLTILGLAAAGVAVYRNLPQLLSEHATQLFADNGVTDVTLTSFNVNHREATVESLVLAGQQGGLQFAAQLDSLRLRYAFWDLLRGRVQALDIGSALVSIDAGAGPAATSSPPPGVGELLPYRLASALPVDSIAIEQMAVTYRPLTHDPVEITGSAMVAADFRSQLIITQGVLRAALVLASDATEPLSGQLAVTSAGEYLGELRYALQPLANLRWRWELDADVRLSTLLEGLRVAPVVEAIAAYHAVLSPLSLAGTTDVEATVEHADDILNALSGGVAITHALTLQARGVHALESLSYEGLMLSGSGSAVSDVVVGNGGVMLGLGGLSLNAAVPTAQLGMDAATAKSLGLSAALPVEVTAASIDVSASPHERAAVAAKDLTVALGDARSGVRVNVPVLTLAALPAGLPDVSQPFTTRLDTATIDARVRGTPVPSLTATLEQSGALISSTVKLQLRDTPGALNALLQGVGDLRSGNGVAELRVGSDDLSAASANWLPLLQSLEWFEQEIALEQGKLVLLVKAGVEQFVTPDNTVESTVSLNGASGTFEDYSFKDLNVDAHWRGIAQVQTIAPAKVTLGLMDIGIPVSDIRVEVALPSRASLPRAQFVIREAQAKLLGGRAFVPAGAAWQLGAASNDVLLRVENWQMASLVALQRSQDIQAVGELSGDLPVTVKAGRVIITEGFIAALPPGGSIRYSPSGSAGALVAGNKELALAVDLLRNFNYETLRSDVALDESGNLALGLSIAGRNPDYSGGRAVQFNINLEQNVDPLLQSLQLSDKLIEELERKSK